MMNNNLPSSLSLHLQDKLDAVVQSPSHFSKLGGLGGSSMPSVVTDSGDDASSASHDALGNIPGVNSIDHSDDEFSINKQNQANKIPTNTNGYKDFSRVLPPKLDGASSLMNQPTSAKEPTFPVKLHLILSNPEFEDIIAWLPHGRSWRILQQKAFEERVIPLYFRHGRYSSFARQVNGWGFRRVTHGSDYNSYYHEMFLRGMPHLCDKMRRLTSKDATSRKKSDEEPAPDFYALSRSNPLPETAAPTVPELNKSGPSVVHNGAGAGNSLFDSMETAALLDHRRCAGLLDRVNLLASSGGASGLRSDPLLASMTANQGGFQGGSLQNSLQGLQGLQNGFQGLQGLQGLQNGFQGLQNGLQGFQGLQGLQNVPSEAARLFMMPGATPSSGYGNSMNNNHHQQMAAAQQQQAQMQQFNFPGSADMAQLLAMNSMGGNNGGASNASGLHQMQMSPLMGAGSLNY